MNYREFASDLPRHRTTTFTSAEEKEKAMWRQGVKERRRQLGSGKVRIDLAVLETDEARLVSDRYSMSMVMTLKPAVGSGGFVFPRTANGQFLASGHDLGNDKLLVMPPGSEADVVIPGLAGTDAITVSQARFAELAHALCRSPRFRHPHEVSPIEACSLLQDECKRGESRGLKLFFTPRRCATNGLPFLRRADPVERAVKRRQ